MIRSLIVFLLTVFGGFFTGLYVAYDEFDPCRALAVERFRRASVVTVVVEPWTTIRTARTDRLTCTKSLIKSWRERLVD